MLLEKVYKLPFVVEQSKLTRLLSAIKNTLERDGTSYKEHFDASLTGGKAVSTQSLQEILELDNSDRSRVQKLSIHCESVSETSHDELHEIDVDFNGDQQAVVMITAVSVNQRMASEVQSVAEEQVERMLERGLFYRIFGSGEGSASGTITAIVGVFTLIALITAVFVAEPTPKIEKTMWLTPSDLAEIQATVQNARTLAPEQATDILTRQLRNLISQESAPQFSEVLDWRVALVLLPVVIAFGSFIALAFCYPHAVFLWGDALDRYQKIVARRKWIWNTIVATLFLGVIVSLAMFGLDRLIGGGST